MGPIIKPSSSFSLKAGATLTLTCYGSKPAGWDLPPRLTVSLNFGLSFVCNVHWQVVVESQSQSDSFIERTFQHITTTNKSKSPNNNKSNTGFRSNLNSIVIFDSNCIVVIWQCCYIHRYIFKCTALKLESKCKFIQTLDQLR